MQTLMLTGSANRSVPYVKNVKGKGISAFRIDTDTGAATELASFDDIENPTFVTFSPDGRLVAAVSEVDGANEGKVSILSVDATTGKLRLLSAQSTAGYTPAHVSFDRTGRFIAVANYAGVPADAPRKANIAIYAVSQDGTLSAPVFTAQHTGSGPNKGRQEQPHGHCVRWTPDNRFVIIADLGIDRLVVYRFADGKAERYGEAELPAGEGPRHFVFHPTNPFAYVVSELGNSVASFAFEAADASFKLLAIEPTLPSGTYQPTSCSAIAITADGRHLFAGNRGHDSVARFAIADNGIARFLATTPSGGKVPRDFALDPSGRLLVVANQDSDVLSVFRHDNGNLAPLATVPVGSPTAIAFPPAG